MKTSLQLKLNQQLTMTPQLQQAIRLLQLSSLELHQEIQQAVEANPLLEAEELQKEPNEVSTSESKDKIDSNHKENSVDNPQDSPWEWQVNSSGAHTPSEELFLQNVPTQTLSEYLTWQLDLTPFTDQERMIATLIIDAIDEDGYLTQSTEDIQESLANILISKEKVEYIIKRVQLFDPIGVASRTLQECLLIQLKQFDKSTPWLQEAENVLTDQMDLLASKEFRLLTRKTKLKEHELKSVLELIQTLNPKPGNSIGQQECNYLTPDVYMRNIKNQWVVELNPQSLPKVGINQNYAQLIHTPLNKTDNQFIRGHLQEAKWFLKSLENRHDTLLKVAQEIVNFQKNFFEFGDEAMKPMVLNDIASSLNMHESTISRVTNQKYLHTPKGVFELKYFFSSHVGTESGGECSSTAIRALIKKLIASENSKKPLSDSKIAQILKDQGIQIARRTIAKYREAMMIQPSNQRKTL